MDSKIIETSFKENWPRISEWIPEDITSQDTKRLAIWVYSEGFSAGFELARKLFTASLKG